MVVNLGTHDFSTVINPGEPWTPDSLVAGYRGAYGDFLQKLRTRYGAETTIVAVGAGDRLIASAHLVHRRSADRPVTAPITWSTTDPTAEHPTPRAAPARAVPARPCRP
ncbi:hypothetical protein AB0J81_28510 [Streptomyces bobili]|uniref:hypothetical protein n=1 Tax=Streptomyces bobili TaxID=67280 RepID=UPI00341968A0